MSERDDAMARLNAMAGVDEHGCILPPTAEDLAAGIDRRALPFWRNPYEATAKKPEARK